MNKLEELINELCPDGVEYKRIDELCIITRGRVMSKDYIRDNVGQYPVYSSQTENNGELGKISTYDFEGEYLTWTTDGANAGSVFYRNGKFSVTNVCGLLKVKVDEITTKYLYHILSITAPKYVNKGMGNPKLMSNVMARIKVPLPPLSIQSEIVHILDSFTLLTAELTAELTARKKQYEFYRDKLLTFGNDTLECRLKDICDIFLGLTATPNYTDAGVKFISAQNTSNDFLDLSNVKYISETDFESTTSNAKPQRGDLLFTRVGSNLGHPVIVETDEKLCIFVSLGYLRVRNKKQVVIGYLKHWMNTDLFWSQVRKNVHGAAKVNLNTGWLKEFRISLPPLETQERIVHVLDNFEAICTDLNIGLPAEIEARQKQYEYYRDKLLSFKELPK